MREKINMSCELLDIFYNYIYNNIYNNYNKKRYKKEKLEYNNNTVRLITV